jgi:hypothetical protein
MEIKMMTLTTSRASRPRAQTLANAAALALLLQIPALAFGDDDKNPIPKVGSCPVGYRTSGNYCIPLESTDKEVIIKLESCPSGYRTSGNYCIKQK